MCFIQKASFHKNYRLYSHTNVTIVGQNTHITKMIVHQTKTKVMIDIMKMGTHLFSNSIEKSLAFQISISFHTLSKYRFPQLNVNSKQATFCNCFENKATQKHTFLKQEKILTCQSQNLRSSLTVKFQEKKMTGLKNRNLSN
jgi:hypoxanthine-guanine phosphoribosyltransferase